jgi:glyoxylase I family protein
VAAHFCFPQGPILKPCFSVRGDRGDDGSRRAGKRKLLFRSVFFALNQPVNIAIEHIGLPARNAETLVAWYESILGAKRLWDNGQNPPSCLLSLGAAWLEIYPAAASPAEATDNKAAGFRHLALRVDSVEAARAELAGRGVKFAEEIRPAGGGGRVLFFADGEGNLLHLVERPRDLQW